jgi:transcriptional regulator with XRE-family HTH domain
MDGLPPGVVHADERLARLLAERMAERKLSLRALARAAGVSHSSVSRLLRGRSRATAEILVALAPALGVPPEALLAAAGIAAADSSGVLATLRGLGIEPVPPELVQRVRAEMDRLREHAGTEAARAHVLRDLEPKLAALGAGGPVVDRLRTLGRIYLSDGSVTEAARLAAGSGVLYFLQAIDAIDDFMWPIGYLDDAVAVALADAEVRRLQGNAPG